MIRKNVATGGLVLYADLCRATSYREAVSYYIPLYLKS